jgi:hypothetical protein
VNGEEHGGAASVADEHGKEEEFENLSSIVR